MILGRLITTARSKPMHHDAILIRLREQVKKAKDTLDDLLISFVEASKALEADGNYKMAESLITSASFVQYMGQDFDSVEKHLPY
jgi:hypothetical protein